MPPIPPLPNKTLTRTEPNFENESQMGKDQVSVVNNCWSEGSYELGVIALNSFREADRRYPSPSDIRHLLALALYPPPSTSLPKRSKPGPRQSTTLFPRKLQAQTEIPSPNASRLALELLLALASTTHPEHLTAGLKSYARAPIDAAELDGAQMEVRSPLVVECVRVGRARDCWVMLREGLLARRDHEAVVRHPNDDDDDSEEEDEIGGGKGAESKCVVAPFAWGVLEWWIKLFEVDQRVQCLEEGSAVPSKLLLSHIPQGSRIGAPQWDVQAPLKVVASACRSSSTIWDLLGLASRLLRLLVNASATYAITPRILVRTTTEHLKGIPSSTFNSIIEDLFETRSPFPSHLYSRFCFCLASLYLAKTGAGVSESGVFGAVSSSKRGPRARPRISGTFEPMGESQMESQMESQTESQIEINQVKPAGTYPYPVPSLQTTLALLRSTPKTPTPETFGMHAVARWTILRALAKEMGCAPGETWMPAYELPQWTTGAVESVQAGFSADANAGANAKECTFWGMVQNQWELLPL